MTRRLTLVIHSLAAGGAERVISILAGEWARRENDVTLLTFDDGKTPPFQKLHPRVVHRQLGLAGSSATPFHALFNNRRRVRLLRQAFRDSSPDVIVSFMVTSNVLSLMAAQPLGLPVIVSERSDPAVHDVGRWRKAFRARVYPRAAAVVVVSETAKAGLPASVRERSAVIPNPVPAPDPSTQAGSGQVPVRAAGSPLRIAALGRLSREKGFDLLLDAFARVAEIHPRWNLTIWGEGAERGELESLRRRLGLEDRVELPGATSAPHSALQAADLFVLPSRFEGFPNALCEAMACGLASISFDCASGPREIINPGVDGVLVPPEDPVALAAAMDRLMSDAPARERLGRSATEVVQRFGLDTVMVRWNALIDQAAGSG